MPLRPHLRHRVHGALRRAVPALAFYAAARLTGMLCLALWAWHAGKPGPRRLLGYSWDSVWYAHIVAHGYGTVRHSAAGDRIYHDVAFFPLYPGLVRAVRSVLSLGFVNAGLLVSWSAAAVAAWGIYAVGERLYGRRTGTLLVVLWGVLPNAIIQSMAYTEPVLSACAAWSLYCVLTRRWLSAGALSALAGLARPNGIAVAAAVCAAAVHQALRSRGARANWRMWAGAAASPLGWLGYVVWVGAREGDPLFGYFRVQQLWGSEFDFGWDALQSVRSMVLGREPFSYFMVFSVVGTALVMFVLLVLDRPPLPLVVYSAVLMVIALGGARYFTCKPRFLLPAFPLLLPAAMGMARARPRTVVVTVGALAGLSCCYGMYVLTIAGSAP